MALDELGRGTATTDGAAVAAAVLQHLSTSIRCRCDPQVSSSSQENLKRVNSCVNSCCSTCPPASAAIAVSGRTLCLPCRRLFLLPLITILDTRTAGGPRCSFVVQVPTSLSTRRGLFATHYHRLSDEHALDPGVAIRHMDCAVTPAGPNGELESVTFLYKLAEGALTDQRIWMNVTCGKQDLHQETATASEGAGT